MSLSPDGSGVVASSVCAMRTGGLGDGFYPTPSMMNKTGNVNPFD